MVIGEVLKSIKRKLFQYSINPEHNKTEPVLPKTASMKYITSRAKSVFLFCRQVFHKPQNGCMVIGEVLKHKGIITGDQLTHALESQSEKLIHLGRAVPIGQIIVELGYASEDEVVKAVNDHYRLSITSLSDNIRGLVEKLRGSFVDRLPAPRLPIWLQLSIAITFAIISTTIVLSYTSINHQKKQLYNQTVKTGMVSLNYFDNNASIPLIEDDILSLNTLLKNATAAEGLLYAIIVDQNQIIKAHTDHNKIGLKFKKNKHIKNLTRNGDTIYYNYTLPSGDTVLNLTRPVIFTKKKLGYVHVGVSMDFIDQLVKKERSFVISVSLIIVFFGIIKSIVLGFRFSRPISKLVQATQEIAKGNYHHRLDMSRKDELGNLATAFNQMSEELRKQSLMQESFGKYVGPEVLELIMANPKKHWLKGHRNEATILFADIRGFTSYTNENEPEQVVEKLNEFFEIATRSILEHDGYIDKFMGDSVLGVFGVPVHRKNHIERAVMAAIFLQDELSKTNGNDNKLLKKIGIGIDYGIVVSGNIGSQIKMEYTVIGNTVNVASRLNGIAGPGEIIISKNVLSQVDHLIHVESLPPQKIKGKLELVEAYKVLSVKQ